MSRDEDVYAAAVEIPVSDRGAFLDRACEGDPALRTRIEALLMANDEADEFFTLPPVPRPALAPEEKPGDRIGRYKLLQKIGEGGCGVVYMAEQEEPVRRRVALKVIKLGMDTKAVVARFEAERQAIALMDHPNIARVLDAGATEAGRPFFVMELVRGIPITRYCDEENLPTPLRLQLFVQVCQAIQHAHEKGIIHRDIKPTNILVTMHDDVAVPKVIDFGIAKATQGRLTDHTVFTAFEQFIGTPAYMSPEQAQFNDLEVDARSDIYSLGVLLYELLTGRPPFDPKTLAQSGIDEIRRIIREVDPPRPSTRLSTLDAADCAAVAKHRATAPAQLSVLMRGDLDWIVMRALEKNRTRRYETANGLAADIKRHLSNEPVVARPPSVAYRCQKFAARNKYVLVSAAAVVVAVGVGLTLSRIVFRDGVWPGRATASAPSQGAGGAVIRVLVTGTDMVSGGVLSPDESMFAYVDWNSHGGAIAVKDMRTGKARTLVPGGTGNSYDFATYLVWSPDSASIAYCWDHGDDDSSLRIVSRNGGEPIVVRKNTDATGFGPFDWSRDGRFLVGERTHADRSVELATLSLETGVIRPLIGILWPRPDHVRFSPGGRFVVYGRIVDGNRNVFLLNVDTAQVTRLTDSVAPAEDGSPIFSADGKFVLFSSNRRGVWDLWGIELGGDQPRGAPFPVKYDFGDRTKRMTSAGKLAFVTPGTGTDVYEVEDTRANGTDARGPKAIAKSFLGQHASPAWSPDGGRIAYVRRRGEIGRQTLLCILSMASGREDTFETGLEFIRRMFWSPDGKALAISGSGGSSEIGIYYYSLETHERRPIKIVSGAPPWPVGFSADGREFIFCFSDQKQCVAFDLASQTERSVSPAVTAPSLAKGLRDFDISPDLSSVVYVARDGAEQHLVVADTSLQNKHVIVRATRPANISAPRWSPDRTRVAYYTSAPGKGMRSQLNVAAADGSWQRSVNIGTKYVSPGSVSPSWSPDGTRLAVTLTEDTAGEIGVLEDFILSTRLTAK